jgi:hypothetical protein
VFPRRAHGEMSTHAPATTFSQLIQPSPNAPRARMAASRVTITPDATLLVVRSRPAARTNEEAIS